MSSLVIVRRRYSNGLSRFSGNVISSEIYGAYFLAFSPLRNISLMCDADAKPSPAIRLSCATPVLATENGSTPVPFNAFIYSTPRILLGSQSTDEISSPKTVLTAFSSSRGSIRRFSFRHAQEPVPFHHKQRLRIFEQFAITAFTAESKMICAVKSRRNRNTCLCKALSPESENTTGSSSTKSAPFSRADFARTNLSHTATSPRWVKAPLIIAMTGSLSTFLHFRANIYDRCETD